MARRPGVDVVAAPRGTDRAFDLGRTILVLSRSAQGGRRKEGDTMSGSTGEAMQGRGEDRGGGVLEAAREKLSAGYDTTSRTMRDAVGYGRSHPVKMSLLAIGAGLGLGLLLLPSRSRRRSRAPLARLVGAAAALRYMLRR
jgi:hypothetical protein